jgi:hypothetical protein
MTAPPTRRLPISCEPCRARKIRCSRTRGPPGACESCLRRGLSPSRCIYLRQTNRQSQSQDDRPSSTGGNNEELLSRIRLLEELVSTHMQTSSSSGPNALPTPVTPSTDPPQSHLNPSEWPVVQEASPLVFPPDPPQMVGTLNISKSGHVRYEPRTAQWNSVLEGSQIATEARTFYEHPGSSDDFPFDLNPTARLDDFLMMLPPISQCDELKSVFFRVFSTVRAFYSSIFSQSLIHLCSCSIFYMTRHSTRSICSFERIGIQYHSHGSHSCFLSSASP